MSTVAWFCLSVALFAAAILTSGWWMSRLPHSRLPVTAIGVVATALWLLAIASMTGMALSVG